jgi:beta-hydroxylase
MYIKYFIIIFIILIFLYKIKTTNAYIIGNYLNFILKNFINNVEYINIDNLNWSLMLKKNYKIILNEYINYIKNNGKLKNNKDLDPIVNNIDIDDIPWEVLFLKIYNRDTNKIKYFPETYKLLSMIPECSLAMFSILPPGKKLEPHYGTYKGVLRYHLGLIIPKKRKDCFLLVNRKKYNWKKGEDVMFDETFLHSAENNTDETRVVLFLDIKRNFNNIILDSFNNFILYSSKFNDSITDIIEKSNID